MQKPLSHDGREPAREKEEGRMQNEAAVATAALARPLSAFLASVENRGSVDGEVKPGQINANQDESRQPHRAKSTVSERGWRLEENVRLCSLMFAYVRLIGKK
jgi:hypothetical protein